MIDLTLHSKACEEIEALHCFFVGWFSGKIANTDNEFAKGFMERFDSQFRLIPPAGINLGLSQLASSIRSGHGSNPRFRIQIRNVVVRRVFADHCLATYEEWQRNALASTPPDNARVASVIFRIDERLKWLHVHETWMPKDVMEAGPYDF